MLCITNNVEIVLDKQCAQQMNNYALSEENIFDVNTPTASGNASANACGVLPLSLRKAAFVCKIVNLTQPQTRATIRLSVINRLISMFNAGFIPPFSSSVGSAGADLLESLISFGRQPLSPAFEISQQEAHILAQGGSFLSAGMASLVAAGAVNAVKTADVIASLSCEVFGCGVDQFDGAMYDTFRPHRGQISSAASLRLMLEGTKSTNVSGCRDLPSCVQQLQQIPHLHGG